MSKTIRVFAVLLFVVLGLACVSGQSCESDEFACADGLDCVSNGFVCDEFPNCEDESDEDPVLCESWTYDYEYGDEEEEEEGGGGGGFFGWGGGGGEEEVEEEPVYYEESDFDEPETIYETDDFDEPTDDYDTKPEQGHYNEQRCSPKQCRPSGRLGFIDGTEYRYTYTSETQTQAIREGNNQSASMSITCDVVVQVLTACEMNIQIENAVFLSSDPTSDGMQRPIDQKPEYLEKEALRFSMTGGEIDSVCPSSREDPRALNFKRGILSMLQNTMPKLHISHSQIEKDIVGECEMNYQYEGTNDVRVVVSKSRNIQSCKSRNHFSSAIQGIPYDFPMKSIPVPIVETISECNQEIEKGIIKDATCSETHDLQPFTSEHEAVRTSVTQKLTFVSESAHFPSFGAVRTRTDILFDHLASSSHENMNNPDQDLASEANRLISVIEDSFQPEEYRATPLDLIPSTSRTFRLLVDILARLSDEELSRIYHQYPWTEEKTRPMFEDAIGVLGTASSLRFMAKEIPSVKDASVVASWVASLALIQSPNIDTISVLPDLMRLERVPHDIYLSAGSLINTYCLEHHACSTHQPVSDVMSVFQELIQSSCRTSNDDQKAKVLMALRGIGNAGMASNDDITASLNACIQELQNQNEMKASAIEAFRRIPCNVTRQSLHDVLRNDLEDAELRILAYLGSMQCPDYNVLQIITDVFSSEEVNQVGSFMWTHLTNIKETGLPSKLEVQSLLSNKEFKEKFKTDFRKFSKNIEWSGFYDALNVGASVESNLIFSQKSYIPRQTTFSLTADIFGRSFNFLEGGVRLEGLDRYVEQLLAGYPKEPRSRDIKSDTIKSLLDRQPRKDEYLDAQPQVSVHMKAFGNEFKHKKLHRMDIASKYQHLSPENIIRSLQHGKEFSITEGSLPLDSSFEVATSTGFPLRVKATGVATVDVSASLKMDVSAIAMGKGMVQGYIKPNLSVNLRGSMVVDGYLTSTGMEIEASVSSSTILDGKVEIDQSTSVSFDFNLPQHRVNILEGKASMMLIHGHSKDSTSTGAGNREELMNTNAPVMDDNHCISLEEAYGISICYLKKRSSMYRYAFNYRTLLHAPYTFNYRIEKTDLTLTSYKFRYHWDRNEKRFLFYLLFDTPGSSINRKSNFVISLDYEKHSIEVTFNSKALNFDVKGTYTWTNEAKLLNLSVDYMLQHRVLIDIGYNMHERSGQRVVIPTFLINFNGRQLIKISGDLDELQRMREHNLVHYGVNVQFEIDLGAIGRSNQRVQGVIGGSLDKKKLDWEANIDAAYSFSDSRESKREEIHFYYKKSMLHMYPLLKIVRNWKMTSTQFPHVNTKGQWARKTLFGSIEDSIQASFGRNYEDPLHNVDFFRNLVFYGGDKQTTFNCTAAIKYPVKNLDVLVGLDFNQEIADINTGFVLQFSTGKTMKSRFRIIRNYIGPLDIDGSFFISIPDWIDLRMRGDVKQTEPNTYEYDFNGSISPTSRLEVTGHYEDLSSRLQNLHRLEMKVKWPSRNIVYTNSTFLSDANQIALASQVKTIDGSKYQLRLAYIIDRPSRTHHEAKRFEIDLNLPRRHYYWHLDVTLSDFITINSDIHVDSLRDINLWIEFRRKDDIKYGSTKVKLLWDANRDPQKKASFEINLLDRAVKDLMLSISLLGNEYKLTWTVFKLYKIDDDFGDRGTFLSMSNHGTLSWIDESRKDHTISFGGSFNSTRGNDFFYFWTKAYVYTPLINWEDNVVNIEYSRERDSISGKMDAKWHKDETLHLLLDINRNTTDKGRFAECKVEVMSFINGKPVTFNTGVIGAIEHDSIDGEAFLKWDMDEVRLILQAADTSGYENIHGSLSGKVLTTLPGYSLMSVFFMLNANPTSVALQGTSKWEETVYQLRFNGDLYKGNDYLNGELYLITPQFGPETASATMRVYHDPKTREEKLITMAKWLNQEVKLTGRVSPHPQNFRAEINLDTPFKKLSQASLSLGHSTGEYYMTEIWLNWNKTKDMGLKLVSNLTSVYDFLISATLKTPFTKFKEVKGELRNLFKLTPSVQVFPRIFGQFNSKKYGLGGRYEHGNSPKLRVGLEMYYPIPGLEEVKFDIADNSSSTNMRYIFEMRHGAERHISINTNFKHSEDAVEFSFGSENTLASLLGPADFAKIILHGDTKLSWTPQGDAFNVGLTATTVSNTYKLFAEGKVDPNGSFKVEGDVALPLGYLNDLGYKIDYRSPTYDDGLQLDTLVTVNGAPVLTIDMEAKLRQFYISFTSPVSGFGYGHLEYKILPLDIRRSSFVGSGMIENYKVDFDGYIYLNDQNYPIKSELTGTTTLEGYKDLKLTLEGRTEQDGGYSVLVLFDTPDDTYEGEIYHRMTSERQWKFRASGYNKAYGKTESYELEISLENVYGKPLTFDFYVHTPGGASEGLVMGVSTFLQYDERPYILTVDWEVPEKPGKLKVILNDFENERIRGTVTLALTDPDGEEDENYELNMDLNNRSTPDEVYLALFTEFESSNKYILVDGTLKQVTSDPGFLQVYLVWPEMNPVNFTARASYSQDPHIDLKTNILLDLTESSYGFLGEINREAEILNMNSGIWWHHETSSQIEMIRLESSFKNDGSSLVGKTTLSLPMVERFKTNSLDMTYKKSMDPQKLDLLQLTLKAGDTITTFTSHLKGSEFPPAEGNATISSSLFRNGEQLTVTFNQALTSDGFTGEYDLGWPSWDAETESFVRKNLRAVLNHSFLNQGQQGTLSLYLPMTKGKPIIFTYLFQFVNEPEVVIKLGITYGNIKFEVKGSHSITMTDSNQVRQTAVELDNLIWPFGIAYVETVSMADVTIETTNDKLVIYDLQDTDRRSSISFARVMDNEGARINLKGILVDREVEISAGYKSLPDLKGAGFLLSWSKEEKIQCALGWEDITTNPEEMTHAFEATITHPLRSVLLQSTLVQSIDGHGFVNVTFNPDSENPENDAVKVDVTYEFKNGFSGAVKLSHPSLASDIELHGLFSSVYTVPLMVDLVLKYSDNPDSDLMFKGQIRRFNIPETSYSNLFQLLHKSTRLATTAKGTIGFGRIGDFVIQQSFEHMTSDGEMHKSQLDSTFFVPNQTLTILVESSERLFDAQMSLHDTGHRQWKLVTTSGTHDSLLSTTTIRLHPTQPVFTVIVQSDAKGGDTDFDGAQQDDVEYPRYEAKTVVIEGGAEDNLTRYVHFSFKHLPQSAPGDSPEFWSQDFNFAAKINHTKLFFSQLWWRKQMEQELKNEVIELMGLTREFKASAVEWARYFVIDAVSEAKERYRPIVLDIKEALQPLVHHLKNESLGFKEDLRSLFHNIKLTKKEKDLKASVVFTVKNIVKGLEKKKFMIKLKEAMAKGTLKKYIKGVIEKVKMMISKIMNRDRDLAGYIRTLKEMFSTFASAYDNAVKHWYLKLRNAISDFKMRVKEWLREKWHALYYSYKPHIFTTLHNIESTSYKIISRVWDIMKRVGDNIKSSTYVQAMEQFYERVKTLYSEISQRSLRDNIKWALKYVNGYILKSLYQVVETVMPFIQDWFEELQNAWRQFISYKGASIINDLSFHFMFATSWVMNQVERTSEKMIDIAAPIIEHGYTVLNQRVIDAQLKNIEAKTEMIWKPKEGNIRYVQKLPFEWLNFFHKPDVSEMFEIPYVSAIKKQVYATDTLSVLDNWYRHFNLNFDPITWIPPFAATGYVIGENNIYTFDGDYIIYKGTCEHLLAADVPYQQWAITIKYNINAPKTILVYTGGQIIELSKQFKVKIDGELSGFPRDLESVFFWRTDGGVHLQHRDGMQIHWNLVHDVVAISMPRPAFLNTVGLLGTNNNEQVDDHLSSNDVIYDDMDDDVQQFVDSWKVDEYCLSQDQTRHVTAVESDTCDGLFSSKTSPFRYCFHQVDPQNFASMCMSTNQNSLQDSSSIALAYRDICQENAVPIKLPPQYISCTYENKDGKVTTLEEGESAVLEKRDIRNAVDVVLVIELGECNRMKLQTKQFHTFITMFAEGMRKERVDSIRFAVVTYGGLGAFRTPQVVTSDAQIFRASKTVMDLMENLQFHNSSNDDYVFPAITYATNLPFVAPVSVVVALFPCTPCQESHGFDYTTMYHILLNNAASLYVFKSEFFDIEKSSIRRKIVGFDKEKAYELKDHKKKKMGDLALKNQIKLPKPQLGLCYPLAIETEGAVFSSELLVKAAKKRLERLALVSGRRAAQNTKKEHDQRCLCLSTPEVTPLLRCDPWEKGDFSVLERYGLHLDEEFHGFNNVESDKREGFYK